jgi:hypothetical protein
MKDHFHGFPVQKGPVRGQNYPIIRNGDRDDRDLFFNCSAKCPILEFAHDRRVFRDDATLGKDDKTLPLIQCFKRFDQCDVAAFKLGAVDSYVELAVHESKDRDVLEIILSDKHCIVAVKRDGSNVHIGAVIRTENVLSSRIQPGSVNNFERNADEYKQGLRPPTVEPAHQPELFWKDDGNKQEEKENHKEQREYYQAIERVQASDQFHVYILFTGQSNAECIKVGVTIVETLRILCPEEQFLLISGAQATEFASMKKQFF